VRNHEVHENHIGDYISSALRHHCDSLSVVGALHLITHIMIWLTRRGNERRMASSLWVSIYGNHLLRDSTDLQQVSGREMYAALSICGLAQLTAAGNGRRAKSILHGGSHFDQKSSAP